MPQVHKVDDVTVVQQCPECGQPMVLTRIEPSDQVNYEKRTFECSTCLYAETVTRQIKLGA